MSSNQTTLPKRIRHWWREERRWRASRSWHCPKCSKKFGHQKERKTWDLKAARKPTKGVIYANPVLPNWMVDGPMLTCRICNVVFPFFWTGVYVKDPSAGRFILPPETILNFDHCVWCGNHSSEVYRDTALVTRVDIERKLTTRYTSIVPDAPWHRKCLLIYRLIYWSFTLLILGGPVVWIASKLDLPFLLALFPASFYGLLIGGCVLSAIKTFGGRTLPERILYGRMEQHSQGGRLCIGVDNLGRIQKW